MRKMLAVACAILFVAGTLVSLVLVNAENLLFKSETYKQTLQSSNVYARLPALLAAQISAGLAGDPALQSVAGAAAGLTPQDWQTLIEVILPPEALRQASEQTLDQIFEYLDGTREVISLPLAAFKQGFASDGAQAIQRILISKPDCTPQWLLDLALGVATGQGSPQPVLCNPPADVLSIVLPVLSQGLQTGVMALPDGVPVFRAADHPDLLPNLQRARLLMRLSWLLPLVALAAMTLLAVRSLQDWLHWWGLALLAAGAGGLLAGLLGGPLAAWLLATLLARIFPFLAPFVQAMPDVISALVRQVTTPVLSQSLAICGLGAGFYCMAILHRRRTARI